MAPCPICYVTGRTFATAPTRSAVTGGADAVRPMVSWVMYSPSIEKIFRRIPSLSDTVDAVVVRVPHAVYWGEVLAIRWIEHFAPHGASGRITERAARSPELLCLRIEHHHTPVHESVAVKS